MSERKPEVTAFYNGACPVCRAEMTAYRRRAEAEGLPLAFCDVAVDAETAAAQGLTSDQALRRLHATDETGKLHVGFDAMLLVWSRVPHTRWLAGVFGNRVTKPASAWCYEHIVSAALYRWAKRRQARQVGSA